MKTTKDDFKNFKHAFVFFVKLFGCDRSYEWGFELKRLKESLAEIQFDDNSHTAVVRLASTVKKSVAQDSNVVKTALHEAIHVLTHRLERAADARYIAEECVSASEEELVMHLEAILWPLLQDKVHEDLKF